MRISQTLSSGITITQDFRDCVRFVMFETEFKGWEYATQGGTLFIVNVNSQILGITASHVFGDFEKSQIAVTNTKFGEHIAGISAIYSPSKPTLDAAGTDITDIAAIRFSPNIDSSYFSDTSYILDDNTSGTSRVGDHLVVHGNIKEKTMIDDRVIAPVFGTLDLKDQGPSSYDPVLREASGTVTNPEFSSITGLSGSPLLNLTRKKLCGMVIRGSLLQGVCKLFYIDVFDILEVLSAIQTGNTSATYKKNLDSR